jgi:biopolymer transport protein ExbD
MIFLCRCLTIGGDECHAPISTGTPTRSSALRCSQLPPQTQTHQQSLAPTGQIVLEYSADGIIAVNSQTIALDQLETRLRDIFAARHDKTLFTMGAPSLRYKAIIGAMDAAKGAGVEKVGIVTKAMRRL